MKEKIKERIMEYKQKKEVDKLIFNYLPENSKNNVKLKEFDYLFIPMILGSLVGMLIIFIFALIGVFF